MREVRVLVVDDQEPFRRAAAAVIEATKGFTLAGIALDGPASVEAVEQHRPDLVLMDVNLPGIDGLEATRRIRCSAAAPTVVLLSTYELADLGVDPLSCGAAAYVAKADFDADCLRRLRDLVPG